MGLLPLTHIRRWLVLVHHAWSWRVPVLRVRIKTRPHSRWNIGMGVAGLTAGSGALPALVDDLTPCLLTMLKNSDCLDTRAEPDVRGISDSM
eukprot:COSAG01_NODE_962_length_12418_cov_57.124492_9_plen_92_part_00